MKKHIFLKIFISTVLALYVLVAFPFSSHSKTKGIKTSYKRYSIFKYKNVDILCEPYIVKKNDWLYKIFRKKGELSKNFSHFLIIFKKINPTISSIDAILPGSRILIPLKKIGKGDYDQSTPGNVDVPVVEFSTIPEDLNLAPFIKKHKIKKGETVSSLINRGFLKKGGSLSKEGIKALQLANPDIKNINIIYEGAVIYLPDPSIKSQPWFNSLISGKATQSKTEIKEKDEKQLKIEAYKLVQLKKYSSLIGGTLLSRGKMYFPKKNNSTQVIDLSLTPVIETDDGSKILITSGNNVNDALLKSVQMYWKDLKIQGMAEAIDKIKNNNKMIPKKNIIIEYKKIIETLLSQTNYDYIPDAKIPFTLNNINLEALFGRVIRKDATDLLINFGIVYGSALEVLEKRKFEIISITPKLTTLELTKKLFSHLEYTTWVNPSFATEETVESIDGIYAVKKQDKLFIPAKPLNTVAIDYLKKEGIKILSTKNKALPQ
jgi:hypothetical protein